MTIKKNNYNAANNISSKFYIIDLPKIPDERGNLTFVEGNCHIPFDIKRVYYLYDIPTQAERAGHAHYELQQLIVATSGSFNINLDDGYQKATVALNNPQKGLIINSMLWRTLTDFSGGAVCLVMASMRYTEDDYIRNYEDFIKAVR